jgi:hypothetical protein
MTKFIMLQMFLAQNSRGSGSSSSSTPRLETNVPFKSWRVGYIVCGKNNQEHFTLKEIHSTDGNLNYTDATALLVNAAGESRLVKGSTLQSGYQFVSKGDVEEETEAPPEKPVREDCTRMCINVADIREFYPRKRGAEGTRILMKDKTAYIVADSFDEVWLMVKQPTVVDVGDFLTNGNRGVNGA